MAKFKFFQDKEVKSWVRDYYTVEAETLDEALEYVKQMGGPLEEGDVNRVEFVERDWDWTNNVMVDVADQDYPERYSIFSQDLFDVDVDPEIVYVDNR